MKTMIKSTPSPTSSIVSILSSIGLVLAVVANTTAAPVSTSTPTISTVPVLRTAGGTSNSTIANVGDTDQAPDTLTVTVNGGASASENGVTVSNISIDSSGVVTATVGTVSDASDADFMLTVTDNTSLTDVAKLAVIVLSDCPGGGTWIEQAHVTTSAGPAQPAFGYSVATDGDTVVVGAPADDTAAGTNAGSVFVFVRSGTTWTQQAELNASDAAANDYFGWSVSISGDTVVIGASDDDTTGGTNAGSAYIFTRSGTVWTEQQHLTASDGAADDLFGWSVAISGDTVIVGAREDEVIIGEPHQGSAYVFTRSGTVWTQQQKLTAGEANGRFGYSVAISGETVVIGALYTNLIGGSFHSGAAFVFTRSSSVWTQQQRLTASDATDPDNQKPQFGWSVSISGDTVIVGAPTDDTPAGGNAGSAYVFTRSGTVWSEQQHLTASDAAADDRFGVSVAVSGDTVVVSAVDDDTAGGTNAGSAYVFTRAGSVWTEQQHLTATDDAAFDQFGASVSVSSEMILVGAPFDDSPAFFDSGSVDVFAKSCAIKTPTATSTNTLTPTATASPTPGCNAVVFDAAFENGISTAFSGAGFVTSVQGFSGYGTTPNVFGGKFFRNNTTGGPRKTTLTLTGLPSHTAIDLDFLLAFIGSWDGSGNPLGAGPDAFNVAVDGSTIFSHTFENSFGGVQSYVPPPNVELARHVELFVPHNGPQFSESAYDMGQDPLFSSIPHTSSTLTLDLFASGPGWEGIENESWAIDNLRVSLVGTCASPTSSPTATVTGSPSCYPTPSNLILWHRAEGNANDVTGNHPGTLQGDTTFAIGKVGQAYSFDGSGDHVSVSGIFSGSDATVDAWVKTSSLSGGLSQTIVAADNGGDFISLRLSDIQDADADGRRVKVHTNVGEIHLPIIPESPTGVWRHIAITTRPGEQRIYENGVLVAMDFVSYSTLNSTSDLRIGGYAGSHYFQGDIDEVEIFNRALSQAEIEGIYNAGSAGRCPPSVSGTITYGNAIGNPPAPRFVQNVVVNGAGSPNVSTTTGTPGTYSLGVGAGSYTVTPSKPGGFNGAINSFDAGRIAQHVAGLVLLTGNQRAAADVTGNNQIQSFDAAKIAGYVAGLPIVPPNLSGTWRFYANPVVPFPPLPPSESRIYASVTSNLTGEDYTALLLGDVSGNWNPSIHPRPAGRVESGKWKVESEGGGPERGIAVDLPQMTVSADKEIIIPVSVQGSANKEIISYEFDLRYDPAVIQPLENPVDVTGTVSRGLFVVANPHEPGLLRVVVYGAMPIDSDGVLLNLRFTAVGGVGSISYLKFENLIFNEGTPRVTAANGFIELVP